MTEDENISVKVTNNEVAIKENGEITYDVHPTTPPNETASLSTNEGAASSTEESPRTIVENVNGCQNSASISEQEVEPTPEEQVEKLRTEKTFRKQEEEWTRRREKVNVNINYLQ